jgi:hypothetical protein
VCVRATRGVAALCAAAWLLTAGTAAAQQSKEFTDAYNAGIDAFRLGKYELARKQLDKAAALEPTLPGPHRFLAAVSQAEGKFEECLDKAKAAIALNPTSSEVGNTQKLHEQCRVSLGRESFTGTYGTGGAIAVSAWAAQDPEAPGEGPRELDGATVSLNGLKYGATPLEPRAFAAGAVEVEVARAGFLPVKLTAQVLAGVVTDVVITLEVDPAAKVTNPIDVDRPKDILIGWLVVRTTVADPEIQIDGAPAKRDAQGRIEAEPGMRSVEVRAPGHEPWTRRVRIARGQSVTIDANPIATADKQAARRKGYYALGAAAVFGAAGAVFGVMELRAIEEAQDIWETETARPSAGGAEATAGVEPVRTREDLDAAVDRSKRWRIFSWTGYGLGAVALGASVYFFLQERSDGASSAVSVVPLVPSGGADGGLGLALTWTREVW